MKYVYPVAAGIGAALAAGLLLFPIVYIVFDNFFELHLFTKPPPNAWINDLIIIITALLWVLIAAAAGGFISVQSAEKKEDFIILLLIISSFIIACIFSGGDLYSTEAIPAIATFIAGCIVGALLGMRHKKKKAKKIKTAWYV